MPYATDIDYNGLIQFNSVYVYVLLSSIDSKSNSLNHNQLPSSLQLFINIFDISFSGYLAKGRNLHR